jgi:hypothetical protein
MALGVVATAHKRLGLVPEGLGLSVQGVREAAPRSYLLTSAAIGTGPPGRAACSRLACGLDGVDTAFPWLAVRNGDPGREATTGNSKERARTSPTARALGHVVGARRHLTTRLPRTRGPLVLAGSSTITCKLRSGPEPTLARRA